MQDQRRAPPVARDGLLVEFASAVGGVLLSVAVMDPIARPNRLDGRAWH